MSTKAPTISMCNCESSLLDSYGYDAESKTLAVKFKNGGKTYHYPDVPADVFDNLSKAESSGQFFLGKIKPHYTGKVI